MLAEPNFIESVASELRFKNSQVETIFEFIAEGATVPFIARYRKEKTGNLDENHIRDIIELKTKQENLYKAKVTAINGIEELGKMTPELMESIVNAKTLKEVEAIYKPYKSKKKTKAMIAIEKGFQVVADSIKQNDEISIPDDLLKDYSEEEILTGSVDIIAAEVSANMDLREDLKETLEKHGGVVSKVKGEKALDKLNDKDRRQVSKFEIYADFDIALSRIKPYQILALNRGEDLGILSVKIEKTEMTYDNIHMHYARVLDTKGSFIELLEEAFKIGYTALFSSVENELRSVLNELGEDDAIAAFQDNLAKLLLTKPEYGNTILTIDPGFAAGCKIVVLDEGGNPIVFDKIFLHSKQTAKIKLAEMLKKYKVNVIVIGNGTGVNETVELLNDITELEIYIVNESGASVYSASKTAQEEFPDLDSLDRGTISIGRRFIDPLSELVKVPVGSIGVGMYQHDMPEKKLEEKLGYVVEDVVNEIGINVNTTSSYVLNHISGIDKRSAKKIYNHRPYKSRQDLRKQLSDKVFELAAGFLRVPESPEKFDNTDIHPEQYDLARYVIENDIKSISVLQGNPSQPSLKLGKGPELFFSPGYEGEMSEGQRGLLVQQSTIDFIWEAYNNIGTDPRVNSTHKKASKKVDMESVGEGDIMEGVVRNVVAFGAFVDIGLKNDGLVHISQLADEFVSDPKDFVEVGQSVRVKITGIDKEKGKIQLSMRGL